MGSSELSLTCRQSEMKPYIPRTISEFLEEVSMISNSSERLSKLDDYVNKLQDEMKKIDAFKRELPLCMLLLTDVMTARKEDRDELPRAAGLSLCMPRIKNVGDNMESCGLNSISNCSGSGSSSAANVQLNSRAGQHRRCWSP
ncbi:myb family transcription factor EFM-like [Olea europaea subsp. europaea]|uniref:Myb family transcription factor EFM-like n=1 Tax=Olea europaea subsp. europaea TaxID=158383 RepID=A0A8S0V2E8_OLEEU|nr:myb family transcription factor EFM-like [Olea europaea subsp. europaea]